MFRAGARQGRGGAGAPARRRRRGRGGRPGRLRGGGRALAAGGDPTQPGGLDHHHGPQPRHRSPPARVTPGRAGSREHSHDARGGRRRAAPDLPLLPPGAVDRGAGGADAAPGRRPHHTRDRARLPGAGDHDGPAPGARQGEDPGRGHSLPRSRCRRSARAAERGARDRLPGLQRGPHRQRGRRADARRAVRGGDPAGAAAGRPHARRARGAGPAGAHAAHRRRGGRPAAAPSSCRLPSRTARCGTAL